MTSNNTLRRPTILRQWWGLLSALLLCIAAAPRPPTPSAEDLRFGVLFELELKAGSPDSRASRSLSGVVPTAGTVHVYAESAALDPWLEVQREGEVLEDRDSGGGTTPYLALEVVAGEVLRVTVGAEPGESGRVRVLLSAVEAAREEREESLLEARALLRGARRHAGRSSWEEARAAVVAAAELLLTRCGAVDREEVVGPLQEAGALAIRAGDLKTAVAVWTPAAAQRRRVMPETHPELLQLRDSLAVATFRLREDESAAAELEEVIRIAEGVMEPSDHRLLTSMNNLAAFLNQLGEPDRARSILRAVLAAASRAPGGQGEGGSESPEAIELRHLAQVNLANAHRLAGDLPVAERLLEQELASQSEVLREDDARLLTIRQNLAAVHLQLGRSERARELYESVLAVRRERLPPEDPDLLRSRLSVADVMVRSGDADLAREVAEEVLGIYRDFLPDHHQAVQRARRILAQSLVAAGELEAAAELAEVAVDAYARAWPPDFRDTLRARLNLASLRAAIGDRDEAVAQLALLVDGLDSYLDRSLTYSPREARERADSVQGIVSLALSLAEVLGEMSELRADLFHLVETARALGSGAFRTGSEAGDDPEVTELRARVLAIRRELNDIGASMSRGVPDTGFDSSAFLRRVQARDRLEEQLSRRLQSLGAVTAEISVENVARALPEGTAAVTWRQYRRLSPGDLVEGMEGEAVLAAFVVRRDATLEVVPLGPMAVIDASVERWRSAVGHSIPRGLESIEQPGVDPLQREGERLRVTALDPVLAAAGDVDRLFACLDGSLHLLPLDALPIAAGADTAGPRYVGDQLQLRLEVSLSRLVDPPRPVSGEPTLFAVGGVDYDASLGRPAGGVRDPAGAERSGRQRSFEHLFETSSEVRNISRMFEQKHSAKAQLLFEDAASKEAFHQYAPQARFLHIATHGYFAAEDVVDRLDFARRGTAAGLGAAESAVRGLAPLSVCGLALAGANRGADSTGRVPGILTAEELAGLDLSRCELAVLSACETSVGLRRAGLGVQSLQAALHAAGVRTAVTSLWRVSDVPTRTLMIGFYRRMWVSQAAPHAALWEAKRELRASPRTAPLRYWSPWILTGGD